MGTGLALGGRVQGGGAGGWVEEAWHHCRNVQCPSFKDECGVTVRGGGGGIAESGKFPENFGRAGFEKKCYNPRKSLNPTHSLPTLFWI